MVATTGVLLRKPLNSPTGRKIRVRAERALGDGLQGRRYAADGRGVFTYSRPEPDERVEHLVAGKYVSTARQVRVPTCSARMGFRQV